MRASDSWQRNKKKAGWQFQPAFYAVAEREGFEPSVEYNPHTRLAGEHHRPLGHLSEVCQSVVLAEGVGFEPTVLSHNGFQDRRLKPLGHPSITAHKYHFEGTLSIKYSIS